MSSEYAVFPCSLLFFSLLAMKLLEYQLKNIFRQYGIPVPDGRVTSFAREAKRIAEVIDGPVVVKAQVLSEGRGMDGGIRLARTPEETEEFASRMVMSGSEVESIEPLGRGLERVVVARIEKLEPHPDADRLQLYIVDGKSELVAAFVLFAVGIQININAFCHGHHFAVRPCSVNDKLIRIFKVKVFQNLGVEENTL